MKSRVVIGFLLVLLLVPTTAGQEATPALEVDLEQLTVAFRERNKIPAVSVAIGDRDKLVYAKAFGLSDVENGVPATEETVFRTASIAKPITAMAVLQLVDQGKIALDDRIRKHCPEFPEKEHELTIRQLLCHQAGIRHYKAPGEAAGTKHYVTIKDSLELFKDDPLLFEPGSQFSYTTYGYSLLGRAVETASGQNFPAYLQANIFDAAGMEDAGLDDSFRIIPNRTRGYYLVTVSSYFNLPLQQRKAVKVGQLLNCQLHDTSMKVPGGGLICTPTDLVKFGQAMLANKLIKAETKTAAWTMQPTRDGQESGYGLGWGIMNDNGVKVVGHSGGQAGTSTMLIIHPEQEVVVAVMCNLQGAPSRKLATELFSGYLGSRTTR